MWTSLSFSPQGTSILALFVLVCVFLCLIKMYKNVIIQQFPLSESHVLFNHLIIWLMNLQNVTEYFFIVKVTFYAFTSFPFYFSIPKLNHLFIFLLSFTVYLSDAQFQFSRVQHLSLDKIQGATSQAITDHIWLHCNMSRIYWHYQEVLKNHGKTKKPCT